MWGFLFGFILGIGAGLLAQSSMRQSGNFDEQIAELRDRVDSVLQRSRDLLAETRSEVEALRQRVGRSTPAGTPGPEMPGGNAG